MPIQFSCSQCQKKMQAPDGTGGKRARCPACSAITQIPGAAVSAAVPVAKVASPASSPTSPPVSDNPFASPATTDFSAHSGSRGHRSGKPDWDAEPSAGAFFSTAKQVLLEPTETFRQMDPNGGLGRPLAYAAIVGVLMGVCLGIMMTLFFVLGAAAEGGGDAVPIVGIGIGMALGFPILYGIFFPIGCLITGGIFHLMLRIVGGAKESMGATTRCVSYVYAGSWPAAILSIIPIVNFVIAFYVIALYVIGLSEVHETTKGRVILAMFMPIFILIAVGLVLGMLLPLFG